MKDITNKLIHYDTRKAFEKDRSRIPFTSIVFIDEDRTIYTHGTEYNSSDIAKRIDQIDQDLIDMLNKSHQDLLDLINELSKYVEDMYKKDVTGWQDKYEELKDKVDKMMKQLAAFINDKDNLRISIDDLQARIELVAKYWDEAQSVFSSIQAEINAMKGTIRIQGEYWDNINSMFNSFKQEVNLQLGTFKTMLESLDIEGKVRTILGREMDGPGGIIYDYVKRIKDGITSSVETWLDVNIPGWKTLVRRIEALEGVDPTQGLSEILAGFEARISEIETGYASITRQWSEWKRTHGDGTVDMSALAEIRTQITEINGRLDVLTEQVSRLTPGNPTESGWEEAIAAIRTRVTELENGVSAMTQLISQIRTENAEAIASVNTQVELINGKLTSLASIVATWIPDPNVDVDDLEDRISKLEVWANSDENGFNLSAVWNKMTAEGKKQFVASIVGIVNDTGESTIKINADKIDLNGKTVFLNAMRTVVSGWLTNDPDFPHPWSNGGGGGGTSSGTTDSDLANRLAALEKWTTDRFYLTGSGVIFDSSSGNYNRVELSTDLGLRHTNTTNSSKHGYILNNNGTGSVAFGNISWDAQGNLTINGAVLSGGTIDNYWTKSEVLNYVATKTIAGGGSNVTQEDVNIWITDYINNEKGKTNNIFNNIPGILVEGDLDGYATSEMLTRAISDFETGETIETLQSGLRKLNASLLDPNGNVYGFVTQAQLGSEVTNALNGNTTFTGLTTWQQSILNNYSGGFSLGLFIKNASGKSVNQGELIVGIINESESSVKINANKVNIGADSFSVTADKVSFGSVELSDILTVAQDVTSSLTHKMNVNNDYLGYTGEIRTLAVTASNYVTANNMTVQGGTLSMNNGASINFVALKDGNGLTAGETGTSITHKKITTPALETTSFTASNRIEAPYVSAGTTVSAGTSFEGGNDNIGTFKALGSTLNLITKSGANTYLVQSLSGDISLIENSSTINVLLKHDGRIKTTGDIEAGGQVTQNSDERLKTVVNNIDVDIQDIANTRIVDYTMNSGKSNGTMSGAIAQDWQNVLPNVVKENEDGYLSLNYAGAALVSAVEAAREIVKLKEENASLKAQIAKIIEKIGGID